MNGDQRRNGVSPENEFPGCTGRMVNLFDLSSGLHSNKLITDGPYDDDSLHSRSESDVGTTPYLRGTDDGLSPWNRKENRIPRKMLTEEDVSNKVELVDNRPNLVAKLMGLDSLPLHHRDFSRRKVKDSATRRTLEEEEDGFSKKIIIQRQTTQILGGSVIEEYKDAPENLQKGKECNRLSPMEGFNDSVDGKKLNFVGQKSMEAKRLVTDEKLRQSNEFQDALKLLSSNQDLFVRFLRKPNSVFSKNLYELYPVPPSPGTKRITVLRPSKTDNFRGSRRRSEESCKKKTRVEKTSDPAIRIQKDDELTPQLTRIVVLKPNNGKIHGIKSEVSPPPCSSPGIINEKPASNQPEDDKAEEFRRLAGEITDKIRTNLTGTRMKKISTTTVFTNACSDNLSSINKWEKEDAIEKLSDSEFMPPSSSSWSYVKSCNGPALGSSESLLSKEAKKRLSERWAKIASHREAQELRCIPRNSNTLGEMLAISQAKNSVGYADETRRQSFLESPTMCNPRIKIEEDPEKVMEKSEKSSLPGKVSSIFFSRNRKLSKNAEDETPESSAHHPETGTFSGSTSNEIKLETCLCSSFLAGTSSDSIKVRHHRGIVSCEKGSAMNLNPSWHQSGPNSILYPPFEIQQSTRSIIDKLHPIELIQHTLRHDGYCSCTSSGRFFQTSTASTRKEEEKNFLRRVQTLLTMAGLENNSSTLRWHSLENPLDPSLRDKYANLENKERAHQASRRKLRSNQILVFDSVIAGLLEIADSGFDWNRKVMSNCRSRSISVEIPPLSMDGVLEKMKEWFNLEAGFGVGEGEESCSQVVESVVRKKVVGREWVEHLKMEANDLGREMEARLMDEMVEEAVIDFANDIR